MEIMDLYSHLATAIMVALVFLFAAIVAWAYWPRHKARFEQDGRIPLRDDD
ncbi:MAG TPA: cbb3-type cytochrome c oxidase subunit 3 [Alphaproteobacteria bacterium]|nr:cbb3-type cytochrome c oxidase subunit 3 [Alphaproteobacteria bacterium]